LTTSFLVYLESLSARFNPGARNCAASQEFYLTKAILYAADGDSAHLSTTSFNLSNPWNERDGQDNQLKENAREK